MSAPPEPAAAGQVGWLAARTGSGALGRLAAGPTRGGWWWLGAAVVVGFAVQGITGALLLVYYVPHPDHAFASAQRILWEVPFGWAVRLIHAHGAGVLLLLGAAHTTVAAARADYRAPRELVWVCGRGLLLLGFAAAISGYVLPWSQLSYWATTISTAPLEKLPLLGLAPALAALARGGAVVGAPTLSRAFVAHVVLLPALLAAGLALHAWLLRQTPPRGATTGRPAVRVVELAMVAVAYGSLLLALAVFAPELAFPPHADVPADPLETPHPIRPEWYLLWASALQSLLPGAVGLVVVALLPLALLALPFLIGARTGPAWRRGLWIAAVWLALGLLTAAGARAEDGEPPDQCVACHEADEDEFVSESVPQWRRSVHAAAEVSCDGCHGGDPRAETERAAHAEQAGWVGSPGWSRMAPFCGACHEQVAESYERGRFGPAAFAGGAFPPSCATCHMASGHDTPPARSDEILSEPLPERLRLVPVLAELRPLVLPLGERRRAIADVLGRLEQRALPPTGFARTLAARRSDWTPAFHRFEPDAFAENAEDAAAALDALAARALAVEAEAGRRGRLGVASLGASALLLVALAALRNRLSR